MRRRTLLRTAGVAAVPTVGGCLGGGEVVASVTKSVSVDPGRGWVTEIPDVSDPGGAVSYTVRSDEQPFDVYFFVDRERYEHYDAYVTGADPAETPGGHDAFSKAAVPREGSGDAASETVYEATTADGGAREPLSATGPYVFVVDHSSYRMENRVGKHDGPLSAFVDLEVVRKRFDV